MSIIEEFGFESNTLNGWLKAGNVSIAASASVVAGPNKFEISAHGSLMAVLTSQGGVTANDIVAGLGLNSTEKSAIDELLAGYAEGRLIQNGAYLARDVYLTAGTRYEIGWQYNSVDYVPWNDGSILSVVSKANASQVPILNGSLSRWTLLGFTNPGTGDYSTGDYGSTGWQLARIEVNESGIYQIGFSVFNLGDTNLDPIFYIDSNRGTTTNNGELVVPIASNKGPSIALATNKNNLKAGETATITFSLSESSIDFAINDVTVTGGALLNFMGSGQSYQATFVPETNSSSNAIVSVASGTFSDAAGYENSDGAEANNKVVIGVDTIAPTVSISSDKSGLKAGETATITFTLSESSADFTSGDVTVAGGTLSNFSGSGQSYKATFTPTVNSTAPGTVSVGSGKFSDGAGNQNVDGLEADNEVGISIDTVRPTIAISSDKSGLKAGETATITFTLSESSADFTSGDVTVAGGTLTNFSGSGQSYTATFTPTVNSMVTGTVSVGSSRFSNASGNANADGTDANNSVSIAVDGVTPTIAISSDKSELKAGGSATITFTLSESSADFEAGDVTVAGGTLSNFSGSGQSYTATFTLGANSTGGQVEVLSNRFSDGAGNENVDGAEANNKVVIGVDTIAPTVSISSDKSGLKAGETATITFTLSESSADFTSGDVTVAGGTLSNFSGSGQSYKATFTPTVNSTAPGTVSVGSGKFSDGAGNQNVDGLEADNEVGISIDTVRPTIAISSDKSGLKAGETATITFTLSESSADFTSGDVTVAGGTLTNFSGSGQSYTATFTPTVNSMVTGTVSVGSSRFSNASGNANADGTDANNSVSIAVDGVTPTIAISSDKSELKAGGSATITFTLSESSADFEAGDVTVAGGTLSNFSGSGQSYTATFTLGANSTGGQVEVLSNRFSDGAGNENVDGAEANNKVVIGVDTIAPTVSISSDKSGLKAGETATITFTLSESSADFTSGDVTVAGGTLSNFSGSGQSYKATFTPTVNSTAPGTVSVGSGKFSDGAGNQNVDGLEADNEVGISIDTVRPTIAISSDKSGLKAGETATITFTLSESSADFTSGDVTVAGGTLTNFSGSGQSYTATFTPTVNSMVTGTVSVGSSRFSNASGNANADGTDANNSVSIAVDGVTPTIAISSDKSELKAGGSATITFTLSESSADFEAGDVTVAGGTLSNFSGSGQSYTATFTLGANSTGGQVEVLSNRFSDGAGNENVDGAEANNKVVIGVDTIAPTVSISSDKSGLKAGETATITFTLSESSADFTSGDVTVAGGTLSNFSGSGQSYKATFTPTVNSTAPGTVSVGSGKFSDGAGNQNVDGLEADNEVGISIDTVRPTIAISSDKSGLKAGETATITFTLSESSADFTSGDVTVAGGTLTNFSGSGQSYTATFTPTVNSMVTGTVSVGSSRFSNASGNANADGTDANNSVSIAVDGVTPTIAISSDKSELKAGGSATITFTLSESSADFEAGDVTVAGGTLSNFSGSGQSYTATFTPTVNSMVTGTVSVGSSRFSNASGNANTDGTDANNSVSIAVDGVTPTIAISSDKSEFKAGGSATITFTLSESSADFTSGDVTVTGGTLSNFSGSGQIYTATFTAFPNSTRTVTLFVPSSTFSDASGNANADGTDANNSVSIAVDGVTPTIAISSDKSELKAGGSATITFTLSESSADFEAGDVTVAGGTLSNFSGSGQSYTATFTLGANSTGGQVEVLSNRFSDGAGNENVDGAEANNKVVIGVDTIAPTVSISSDKSGLKAGETATITFTLSESSADFTSGDVTVAGGTLSNFSGSGQSYKATFTPTVNSTAPGTVSVGSGKFSDGAGNQNVDGLEADNEVGISIDTVRPTIAISSDKSGLKAGETATITFTLSESSADFTSGDVTVAGGTLTNFSGSGQSYTATFTLTSSSFDSVMIGVPDGALSDDAGNQNADGEDEDNWVTLSVDITPPTIIISSDKASLSSGESTKIIFHLSESSQDFTPADISVSGGTLSGFAGSGATFSAFFTLLSAQSNGKVSVASNTFSNDAGRFNIDGADSNNYVVLAGSKLFGTVRNDYGRAVATGPDGSIYLAGETEGNLNGQSGAGMRDIFLSKMNPDGTAAWTKLAGTRLVDEATDLAVASDGMVYVAAMSQASLNGSGNSGSYDAYLLKYDEDGTLLWTSRLGTSSIDRGYGVATDATSGAIYLVGQSQGRLDGQRNSGSFDGFISKLDPGGSKLWTRLVGTTGIDVIKDVTTDSAGFVYVTGSVSGKLPGQSRIGGTDAFIAKYSGDGTLVWSKVFGTKLGDVGECVGLGSDGSIYVGGQTLGSMNGVSSGNYDVFLSKFSPSGNLIWTRQFGSGKADGATDLVVGSGGSIFLTGFLGLNVLGELSFGLQDSFVVEYSPEGVPVDLEVMGTSKNDIGTGLAQSRDGVIYLTGYTLGSLMTGKASNGAADAYFLAKPKQIPISTIDRNVAASPSPDIFTFVEGSYSASVTGGFAYGDRLEFPSSFSKLSVSNLDPSDGEIVFIAEGSAHQIIVTLTGVPAVSDESVTSLDSFWATFGPPGD